MLSIKAIILSLGARIAGVVALLAIISLFAQPARAAVTYASVGTATCAAASTCTVTLSSSVAAGSFVLVTAVASTNINSDTVSIADNASNCAGSYARPYTSNNSDGSIILGSCITTNAMTTSNTITLTNSYGTPSVSIQVLVVSGSNGMIDKTGTNVTGNYTNGVAATYAASPSLSYHSESALGIVVANITATTDTMGSITGGYSAVTALVGATKPGVFLFAQTLTSGTATLGGTPSTTTTGRYTNSVVILVPTAGSAGLTAGFRNMMGVGQ